MNLSPEVHSCLSETYGFGVYSKSRSVCYPARSRPEDGYATGIIRWLAVNRVSAHRMSGSVEDVAFLM